MTMQTTVAARIAAAGVRPIVPTALFSKPGDDYAARRDQAIATGQAWDSAIKHIVADAVRIADDSEVIGLAGLICPSSKREDGTVDRKSLAAAIIAGDYQMIDGAAGLARLFERA